MPHDDDIEKLQMTHSFQEFQQIFTARKRSCRKVMISQACVSHSVHGGGLPPKVGGGGGEGMGWSASRHTP